MDVADARSLRYHEVAFAKLQATPALMQRIGAKLAEWAASDSRSLHHWAAYFSASITEDFEGLRSTLLAPNDKGQALRSASPFGTLLEPNERKRLFYSVKRGA
jgi:hypothetical protein